ncbi:hypothetical protein [Burkholderia ubonensis]|uniref:hypothetical protein n=1 Tax=Burkholderia ubonensis TaxID=101571 RepID=UPI001587E096
MRSIGIEVAARLLVGIGFSKNLGALHQRQVALGGLQIDHATKRIPVALGAEQIDEFCRIAPKHRCIKRRAGEALGKLSQAMLGRAWICRPGDRQLEILRQLCAVGAEIPRLERLEVKAYALVRVGLAEDVVAVKR